MTQPPGKSSAAASAAPVSPPAAVTSPPAAAVSSPTVGPQLGILERAPQVLLLLAVNLIGSDTRSAVESLRALVRAELAGTIEPLGAADQPPAETGELGYLERHTTEHLTVTVGFSSSGYDRLGVAAADRPRDLVPIPWARLGDTPGDAASGDLVLQICADDAFIVEHVARRIEHELAAQLTIVWSHTGNQRYGSPEAPATRHDGRAWIGFLDGTSNLKPRKVDADRSLTLVDPDPAVIATYAANPQNGAPGYGPSNQPTFPADLRHPPASEPAWTKDGSYLVARISVNALPTWDSTALQVQEQTIGRTKVRGISLDLIDAAHEDAHPDTVPAFATNPELTAVALDAHIRKANPRGPGDEQRRIYRRGYPLYEGGDGAIRRGLVFLCYGRTLSTQFEFITCGWTTNPNFPAPGTGVDLLRAFDSDVLAGGYYFVPPLDDHRHPWSWHIPAAE